MSLPVSVDVPFADTSSAQLRFSLTHPRITPLASEVIDVGAGLRLELHVIGSSHQAVLAEAAGDVLVETFACLPDDDAVTDAVTNGPTATALDPAWGQTVTTPGAWAGHSRHEFRCTRRTVGGAFSASVAEVLDRVRAHDRHLIATFPGDPDALTALALTRSEPGHMSWQTWHVYPQHREIVHSTSGLGAASARGEQG